MNVKLVLLLVLLLPRLSRAQAGAESILAGVDSVDAQLDLKWDGRIKDLDEETTRSRLQTVFELELRQHGIVVSKGASNYLTISLVLLYNEMGSVSYAWGISLSEPGFAKREITDSIVESIANLDLKTTRAITASDSARASMQLRAQLWDRFYQAYDTSKTTWVTTWTGPEGVARVGSLNLRDGLERRTTELAQAFVNAYIAVHPRR